MSQDASPGLARIFQKEVSQDYVLGHFQPSLRDWFFLSNPTQHYVLGYSQPSLRDSIVNRRFSRSL